MRRRLDWGAVALVSWLPITIVSACMYTAACVPKRDVVTVGHLQALRDSQTECRSYVEYERAKKGQTGYDERTERHIRELCTCFETAGTNATKREACMLTLGAAIVYEQNKIRGAR